MTRVIRVLVVDDSAFVRKVMRQMLSRSPFLEVVATARDGSEALEMVEQFAPDVVTLDLNMPSSDGISFLRAQMQRRPVPVIIVSMASKDGQQVLEALDAGAVDVIQKPTGLATEQLLEITQELLAKVKAAAMLPLRKQQPLDAAAAAPPLLPLTVGHPNVDVVVCGISTGGPQALKYLIPRLPANFSVPIVIVLHMPVGYTELFARSLNEISALEVREAQAGDVLRSGLVLLAPAGYHLTLHRMQQQVTVHLDLLPLETAHRPAADILFKSAAEVYGDRTLAVVMTGMGSDGTQGAAWIKAKGGKVLVESEESCVVYGMPRSVVEAGLCDRSEPLGRMAATLLEILSCPGS